MKKRLLSLVLVAALAFSLPLAGCGPAGSDSSAPPDGSSVPGTEQTNSPEVTRGGNLVLASSPITNYWGVSNFTGGEATQMHALYEPLGRYDTEGVMQPFLADSFEVDLEANTLTIGVTPAAIFQDGSEFNAEVLKWNLDTIKSYNATRVDNFTECEVVGDTVVVHFENVNLYAVNVFGVLLMSSKEAYDSHVSGTELDAAGNNLAAVTWCTENPVGSGPFYCNTAADATPAVTTLRAWDGYRIEGLPYLDSITIVDVRGVDNATLAGGIMNGEYNWVNCATNLMAAQMLQQNGMTATVNGNTLADTSIVSMMPNTVKETNDDGTPNALRDPNVRKALAYAIDYDGFRQAIDCGFSSFATQYAAPGTDVYNDDIAGYPTNTEKAVQLLTEAGFSESNPLKVKIHSTQMNMSTATAIQGEWNKLGLVECEIITVEFSAFRAQYTSASFDGFCIAVNGLGYPDAAASMSNFFAANSYGASIDGAEEIRGLILEAVRAKDVETRTVKLREINQIIYDGCLMIPLDLKGTVIFTTPDIKDHGCDRTANSDWTPELVWMDK